MCYHKQVRHFHELFHGAHRHNPKPVLLLRAVKFDSKAFVSESKKKPKNKLFKFSQFGHWMLLMRLLKKQNNKTNTGLALFLNRKKRHIELLNQIEVKDKNDSQKIFLYWHFCFEFHSKKQKQKSWKNRRKKWLSMAQNFYLSHGM